MIDYAVEVEILEINAISNNIDDGTAPDFYAKIRIGSDERKTGTRQDRRHFEPHWKHKYGFSRSDFDQRIPIRMQLWDEDDISPDDRIDINPASGAKSYEMGLMFDRHADHVGDVAGHLYLPDGTEVEGSELTCTNEARWETGRLHVRGAGDSDRAEIWYTVRVFHVPDFHIDNVRPDTHGHMLVDVHNNGGPGRITRVNSYDPSSGQKHEEAREIAIGAGRRMTFVYDRDWVRSTVVSVGGVDNFGNAEIETTDNSFTLQ